MTNKEAIARNTVAESAQNGESASEACRIFTNPNEIAQDLSILHRLARSPRWLKLNRSRQRWLYQRLFKIISKEFVSVPCGEGSFNSESEADKNAMKAMQLLGMFEAQNQKDQHKRIDVENPQAGTTVNVGVKFDASQRVQELIQQPEYLEWLRDRARNDGNASVLG